MKLPEEHMYILDTLKLRSMNEITRTIKSLENVVSSISSDRIQKTYSTLKNYLLVESDIISVSDKITKFVHICANTVLEHLVRLEKKAVQIVDYIENMEHTEDNYQMLLDWNQNLYRYQILCLISSISIVSLATKIPLSPYIIKTFEIIKNKRTFPLEFDSRSFHNSVINFIKQGNKGKRAKDSLLADVVECAKELSSSGFLDTEVLSRRIENILSNEILSKENTLEEWKKLGREIAIDKNENSDSWKAWLDIGGELRNSESWAGDIKSDLKDQIKETVLGLTQGKNVDHEKKLVGIPPTQSSRVLNLNIQGIDFIVMKELIELYSSMITKMANNGCCLGKNMEHTVDYDAEHVKQVQVHAGACNSCKKTSCNDNCGSGQCDSCGGACSSCRKPTCNSCNNYSQCNSCNGGSEIVQVMRRLADDIFNE